MHNLAYDPGIGYSPAANIERTLYGTTVIRVADDRPARPQMMMPFVGAGGGGGGGNPYASERNQAAFKYHTVRATRLGAPMSITIEPPPLYSQVNSGFQIEAPPQNQWLPLQPPQPTLIGQQHQPPVVIRTPAGTFSRQTGVMAGGQFIPTMQQHQQQQQQQIINVNQHLLNPGCEPIPIYRPHPGRMMSSESGMMKPPIEMYAPRSFASDTIDIAPSKKMRREKMKKKKNRDKVIVTAKVVKQQVTPQPQPKPQVSRKYEKSQQRHSKRRDSVSTSSSSSSSSGSSSASSDSSSESSDDDGGEGGDVEKAPKKKMKKAPKVNHYLEYAIVSIFFNLFFGIVAIVLSVSSMQSKKRRKFRQARWEGVFAGITATLGLVVSAAIVVIVLLYIYTDMICNDCV